MPYTQVSISDYNASPPTDDGDDTVVNQVTWAGIKTKLGDPINTAIESINTNAGTACGTLDASVIALDTAISGLTTDLGTFDGVLGAPDDTELFFVQTAAPTGW